MTQKEELLQAELNALRAEFEQYKKESIKWCVDDFIELDMPGWTITPEEAQEALEDMIGNHDASTGIKWRTVELYYMDFATKNKTE